MVEGKGSDLSNWKDVGEITSQIVAHSWKVANCNNQLRLSLKGSQHLKRDWLEEEVLSVWHGGVGKESDVTILSGNKWVSFALNDLKLPWILIQTDESQDEASSVFSIVKVTSCIHLC